eukprot:8122584-Alexandrium_andersonii.AAC.1
MCLYVWPTVRTSSPSRVHGVVGVPVAKNRWLRALEPLPRRATTAAVSPGLKLRKDTALGHDPARSLSDHPQLVDKGGWGLAPQRDGSVVDLFDVAADHLCQGGSGRTAADIRLFSASLRSPRMAWAACSVLRPGSEPNCLAGVYLV